MTTEIIETESSTRPQEQVAEPGDHERLSHYVEKHKLTEAMIEGIAIEALCGKFWVPSRDGTKFPLCPECKQIWEAMPPGPS